MMASEDKLADLDQAGLPEPGVNGVVGRVQKIISDANQHMAAENAAAQAEKIPGEENPSTDDEDVRILFYIA